MEKKKTVYVVVDDNNQITEIYDTMEEAQAAGAEAVPREMTPEEIENLRDELGAESEEWEDEDDTKEPKDDWSDDIEE